MKYYAGFDTSCYTTSFAVVCGGEVVIDKRIMLDVKKGERGLRQSEMVFQHVRNLSRIFEDLKLDFPIKAVGASIAPRLAEGSYMPVFTVGSGAARIMAAASNTEFHEFSHQQGHIMAALHSAGKTELLGKEFIAFHLSGGTTEMLAVRGEQCEIIGGTRDISFGQLIDRVGVSLGLDFPCGKHLERLAEGVDKPEKLKPAVDGTFVNLSGAETKFIHQMTAAKEFIAAAVLEYTADCIVKMCNNAREKYRIDDILLMGGVAANKQLRGRLDKQVYFGSPQLSCDNAVGIALMAQRRDSRSDDIQ